MEKTYEELPPDSLEAQLLSRKHQIEALLSQKHKALKAAPKGKLRVTSCKGTVQYHLVTGESNKSGKYIPKKEQALIKALAQKEYDLKLVEDLLSQIQQIEQALANLQKHNVAEVYEKLSAHRKTLVTPVTLPPADYIHLWQEQDYPRKQFEKNTPELYTAKGERVRSKSEVIIADTLGRLKIPYRYEYPLRLRRFTVHPDFYCLNPHTRQEFAWEHFGIMDNPEYASAAVEKIAAYQETGYFPGKNLIITMETGANPISSKHVEKLAREMLA